MNELLLIAVNAAIQAGKKILDIYNLEDIKVKIKPDKSPITVADIASNQIIESFLKKTNIPILSEEGKDIQYNERKAWNKLWIVDPIDGTKEFIERNGEFTVNIALVNNQKPVIGVIFVPVLNQLYFSTKDIGSFKVSVDIKSFKIEELFNKSVKLPIKRKDNTYTIVASKSHLSKETENYIDDIRKVKGNIRLISKGSSLKLCLVAEGIADCYPRFAPTMEWDTAAGQALCEHAGFRVIDWKTKKHMIYNRENLLNNWFLVN